MRQSMIEAMWTARRQWPRPRKNDRVRDTLDASAVAPRSPRPTVALALSRRLPANSGTQGTHLPCVPSAFNLICHYGINRVRLSLQVTS